MGNLSRQPTRRPPPNNEPSKQGPLSRRIDVRQPRVQPQHAALAAFAIVVAVIVVYIPATRGGFIWDDPLYVTNNPTLRTLDGLQRIWFEIGATIQYYPLVFTTFWIDYHFWELNPFGYHLVNVLLHAVNALLLWLILRRFQVPGAWLAAAVFALHPVHVESVAWITERKNVLSGLFYLLATLAYLRFCHPDVNRPLGSRAWLIYPAALLLFICALLSKTVTCSLPAAILLLLWWRRDRLARRDILPLLPMFLVGLVMGLITIWMEKHHVGATGEEWDLSVLERCLVAGRIPWFYVGKLVWPVDLTFIYPRWQVDANVWWQYLYPLATIGVVVTFWLSRRRIGKAPLVAVLFFLGTLVPALGFIDVYPMRFSFVADHFQYLASIGPITLMSALATWVLTKKTRQHRPAQPGQPMNSFLPVVRLSLMAAALGMLGTLTWNQGKAYNDLETLWRNTLAKNPSAWMAHNNLGFELYAQGRVAEALEHFTAAIRLKPGLADAHYNVGVVLAEEGRLDKAIEHYTEALRIEPKYARAHVNLGLALDRQGKFDKAVAHYTEALRIRPRFSKAQLKLGAALRRRGRFDEAIHHSGAVVKLNPAYAEAHNELGNVLLAEGKHEQAIEHYRKALQINRDYATAHYNLGVALKSQGKIDDAIAEYREALRIRPDFTKARRSLEAALAGQSKPPGPQR